MSPDVPANRIIPLTHVALSIMFIQHFDLVNHRAYQLSPVNCVCMKKTPGKPELLTLVS